MKVSQLMRKLESANPEAEVLLSKDLDGRVCVSIDDISFEMIEIGSTSLESVDMDDLLEDDPDADMDRFAEVIILWPTD